MQMAVEAVERVPTIEKVFWDNYEGDSHGNTDYPGLDERFVCGPWWEGDGAVESTSAEDPLIILYTSGTTGKPKGIAHTHASFPIKAAQDMAFGTDVGRGTRISWYTDIGWMMGPWLIYGALINGATICIYDGAPDYPTPDRMWEFCAKHKVEVLGISPTLVRSLAAAEERNADASVRVSESSSTKKGWYSRGYLPHFDGNVTQFVTFRLADSLPQSVLRQIERDVEQEGVTDSAKAKRIRLEEYLDSGVGDCILQDPEVAAIVRDTILNEHGKTCRVDAWVIMPNHGHVLLRPNPDANLSTIVKSIKSVSAHKINKLLGRSGPVWQPDYFDRYIRDAEHYEKALRYIEKNPVKAGLCAEPSDWEFSSAYGKAMPEEPQTPNGTRTPSSASGVESSHADEGVRVPPHERHDLSSLRIFASTGEPWNPAPWWWLFEKVGHSKLPIINYSGGTEIAGGILMGNPLLPIKPCSFPAPCPGMDVDILDEDGNSVPAGKVGELVIKQPWIGMARGFWQEKERYLETYWRRFKDIWVHGDWAMRDDDGHWFILGRSDDTLKVAGKRVGPAEVESLLVAHPLVTEAAVIGVPDEVKGTAMVAFVVLGNAGISPASHASETLAVQLKALVAKDMGKPLAPSKIHFVSALPKTRNAKVMRRVIRSAYLGEDPGDLSALENPGAVEEIHGMMV
jgi:acyl-coenzyme A synthetase/AMP-(fatty) acid ligase/REP element-mobilizing transposase RayT